MTYDDTLSYCCHFTSTLEEERLETRLGHENDYPDEGYSTSDAHEPEPEPPR